MLRQLTSKVACKSFLIIKLAYLPAEKARIANSACSDPIESFGPCVVFCLRFPISLSRRLFSSWSSPRRMYESREPFANGEA
jgi:hypothetical protein